MAIKFSQFSESTTTSQVDFIVGYDGNQNVRISPSNFLAALGDYLPLTGGTLTGNLTAPAFIKTGGTSSEFLKADGTVDTNTYLTTTTGDARYVELSGDTMTGDLTILKSTPVFELNSNSIYPFGKIEFAGSTNQPFEIVGQSNPSTQSLALRGDAAGTMTDAFAVKQFSGSLYNYSAVPLRIGADATANEFDDYEEGTFNLSFIIANMGFTTVYDITDFTNGTETSKYVKIGRFVHCYGEIGWSTTPSWGSGQILFFAGFPFSPASSYQGNGSWSSFGQSTNVNSKVLFPYSYGGSTHGVAIESTRSNITGNFQPIYQSEWITTAPITPRKFYYSFQYYTNN